MNNSKLSKTDMKKIGNNEQQAKRKKKVSTIILRCFEALIGVAYVVIMVLGRFFLPKDNKFYKSFDLFSGVNPLPIARILSYVLLVIVAATILRIIIGGLSKNEKITKKISIMLIVP